jgi:hypothetical protein
LSPIGVGKAFELVGSSRQVAPAQQDNGREPRLGAADVCVESFERYPLTSPHRANRNPQDGRDLAVGSALQVRERDDAAFLSAQLGHATADGVPVQRGRQRLPFSSGRLVCRQIVGEQLPRVAVVSAAAAGIDAKYVVAAGQPGPHGIQPAVVPPRPLGRTIRRLVLESLHTISTVIPTPPIRPTNRSPRAYTTPELGARTGPV